mgnify:CR=1 FL=1
MTISMIKLTNGETLLGDIISEDEWTITINNPIAIMVKMRFSPTMVSHLWLPFSDMDNYFDIKTSTCTSSFCKYNVCKKTVK